MSLINQQIVLAKRPHGAPQPDNFKLIETPVPELKEGEVLLKTKYFSLDPYMRGRMNEGPSYAPCFNIGEVLSGGAVCTIEASKNPSFKVGESVLSYTGWQTYAVSKGDINKIPDTVKSSYFLGVLGMPGFTAYYGLTTIGQPKAGETVVVAAATGPVGSMVGQLAKLKGCRVVGIAGGADKCTFATQELGFDACVDHKSATFKDDLKKACSSGIDVYYENVGGPVFMAVLPLLNTFSRIPLCGLIAHYNNAGLPQGPDLTPLIAGTFLKNRVKYQGFIISDHYDQIEDFLKEMIPLVLSGKVKVKEDIVKGIENAPQAFIGLLEGKNFGKLIVEV